MLPAQNKQYFSRLRDSAKMVTGVVVLTVTATMADGNSETIEANVEFV